MERIFEVRRWEEGRGEMGRVYIVGRKMGEDLGESETEDIGVA